MTGHAAKVMKLARARGHESDRRRPRGAAESLRFDFQIRKRNVMLRAFRTRNRYLDRITQFDFQIRIDVSVFVFIYKLPIRDICSQYEMANLNANRVLTRMRRNGGLTRRPTVYHAARRQ